MLIVDAAGKQVGEHSIDLELDAGRNTFTTSAKFDTTQAGHHTLGYTLFAVPEDLEEPLPLGWCFARL